MMSTTENKSGLALKVVLPVLIIAIGIAAFILLTHLKKEPPRQQPRAQGVLVETTRLAAVDHQVIVYASGTVSPARQISLTSQVAGRISQVSPKLVAGGLVSAGEVLFEIEAADYQLAVEQARAEVAQGEVALAKEQEQARIAREEWTRIDLPDKGEPGPLVSREIQLKQQQAILAAAKAQLKKAQINLDRTTVRAPFNGRIREEAIGLGQYVSPGVSLGVLAGTDVAEIAIPLATAEAAWLTQYKAGEIKADIYQAENSRNHWTGKVVRSLGEIDPASRTATLILAVADPYHLQSGSAAPVLPHGQFVAVEIQGPVLNDVVIIPRQALQDGNQIRLVGEGNKLRLQQVEILRREQDQLILRNDGLDDQQLILTSLTGAAPGTQLRIAGAEKKP